MYDTSPASIMRDKKLGKLWKKAEVSGFSGKWLELFCLSKKGPEIVWLRTGLSQQGVRVSFWHPGPRKIPILGGKRHPIFWSEFFENINYK